MRRTAAAIILAIWIGGTGCVERRMVVVTDPPGALVLKNGQPIGNAPADDHFLFYGTYHFTAIKPGYATLQAYKTLWAPWYQWFPLDLFSEIFYPFQIEDVRRIELKLEPLVEEQPQKVADRAATVRERGKAIIPPPPTPILQTREVPPWYTIPGAQPPGSGPPGGNVIAPPGAVAPVPFGSPTPIPDPAATSPAPPMPGQDVAPGFTQPGMQR